MTDRELMQQVLRFLQQVIAYSNEEMARLDELKKLVRERLSQQEQTRSEKLLEAGYTRRSKGWSKDDPKPVAWREINLMGKWKTRYYDYNEDGRGEPLYAAPPKREWVGLTDEEFDQIVPYCHNEFDLNDYKDFARAIEAKLKEKNT